MKLTYIELWKYAFGDDRFPQGKSEDYVFAKLNILWWDVWYRNFIEKNPNSVTAIHCIWEKDTTGRGNWVDRPLTRAEFEIAHRPHLGRGTEFNAEDLSKALEIVNKKQNKK